MTSVEVKTETPQVTHHICLSFRPHTPDVQYGVAQIQRQNIDRDSEGVETRESIERSKQRGHAARTGPTAAAQAGGPGGIEECYEPGRPAADFRVHNAAKLIPAGTDIWVNLHYTPNGTPITDHVQIGFTVAKQAPERRYLAMSTSSSIIASALRCTRDRSRRCPATWKRTKLSSVARRGTCTSRNASAASLAPELRTRFRSWAFWSVARTARAAFVLRSSLIARSTRYRAKSARTSPRALRCIPISCSHTRAWPGTTRTRSWITP